jgi:hypothetical protein
MFVVTSLPSPSGNGHREFTYTFSSKYCLCECDDGQKSITPIGNFIQLRVMIDKTETRHKELIIMPGTPDYNGWVRFPIGTFDKILENVLDFKREGDLLNF